VRLIGSSEQSVSATTLAMRGVCPTSASSPNTPPGPRRSTTPPPREFVGAANTDLAFTGHYVIQGSYNGFQVWDIADPAHPTLTKGFVCPASQSDVSVYRNLLFVSGEDLGARLDCGTQGVPDSVSHDRLRGIRLRRGIEGIEPRRRRRAAAADHQHADDRTEPDREAPGHHSPPPFLPRISDSGWRSR